MDGKTKPFGLAVPKYQDFGFKGPYFGDLVWKHLQTPWHDGKTGEKIDRSEKFEYIPVDVDLFPDKAEKTVVKENVREKVVLIIHPPYLPPAQHLMVGAETGDAISRSDSKEIYIFDLYNSYFRQDARTDREPITAAMVPQIYAMAGINGYSQ